MFYNYLIVTGALLVMVMMLTGSTPVFSTKL